MRHIPNLLSALRILLSLFLFFLQPFTPPFRLIFLLSGLSDVLDGFLARRFHWESELGGRLDTLGDLIFMALALLRLLPELILPLWVWLAFAAVVLLRLWGLSRSGLPPHSSANRLCGVLLYLYLLCAEPGVSPLWALPLLLCALYASLRDAKSC